MKEDNLKLVDQIMTALTTVIDPELQVDVVNLGLIYGIEVVHEVATVKMTLTISGCPLSSFLQTEIEQAVTSIDGIRTCHVELVWYPVWSPEKMTLAAKRRLGMLDKEKAKDKTAKVIDFNLPLKQVASRYPDFTQIMLAAGFTRIKLPGFLETVGRVMTIKMGIEAMNLDLSLVKEKFIEKGYRILV